MREVNRIARGLGLAGLVAACGTAPSPFPGLQPLTLGVRMGLENMCTGSQSPPIRVLEVPEATASYRIRITNVSVLLQSPREWTVAAPTEKGLLPFGALDNWTGPCLGDLQRYRYRIEALALDAAGTPIAYGQTEDAVDPVNEQAQRLWRRTGTAPPIDPTVPPDPRAGRPGEPTMALPRERDDFFRERERRNQPTADPFGPGYLQR